MLGENQVMERNFIGWAWETIKTTWLPYFAGIIVGMDVFSLGKSWISFALILLVYLCLRIFESSRQTYNNPN